MLLGYATTGAGGGSFGNKYLEGKMGSELKGSVANDYMLRILAFHHIYIAMSWGRNCRFCIQISMWAMQGQLAFAALALLSYYLFRCLRRILTTTAVPVILAIVGGTCFNPYIYHLVSNNPADTVEQVGWALFMLTDAVEPHSHLHYVWLAVSTILNPSNILFFLINIPSASCKKLKTTIYLAMAAVTLVYCFYNSASPLDYGSLYFPSSFEPQFNLVWMLYAHMFDRYLRLFQTVYIILQASSVFLLGLLQLRPAFKLVVLTYFKVYCTYRCSELCLVASVAVSILLLHQELGNLIERWSALGKQEEVVKVKTLTLIIAIANIAFFPLDKILLTKYLTDFSINIGYLFLFFGFPWILNSVYLSEITLSASELQTQEEQDQEAKK